MAKKQIATFLGPQPGLSIAGDFSYAYSGIINHGSITPTSFLKFKTGDFVFVGNVTFFVTETGNDSDTLLELKLNDVIVVKARYIYAHWVTTDQPIPIIIPANTNFEGLLGTDTTQDLTMSMTGRIYRDV